MDRSGDIREISIDPSAPIEDDRISALDNPVVSAVMRRRGIRTTSNYAGGFRKPLRGADIKEALQGLEFRESRYLA
jgi:hypothetical protein